MAWNYENLPPWVRRQLEDQQPQHKPGPKPLFSPIFPKASRLADWEVWEPALLPTPFINDIFFYEAHHLHNLELREMEFARRHQMGYYQQHPPIFNSNCPGRPKRKVRRNSKSCGSNDAKFKSSPPARPKKRKLADSPPSCSSAKRFKDNSPENLTELVVPKPESKDLSGICPKALNLEVAAGPQNFLRAYKTKKIPEKVLQSLLPESWSPDCFQNFHRSIIRRKCPVDSPEFQKLNPAFDNSVVEIEKIENPYLWLVFKLKGMEIFSDEGQEVRLFHGTEGKKVGPIIKDNFDYRLAGTCRGHRYGKGVNFSFNPIFCKGYAAKGRCIIMARVLMGRIHLGNEHTILPDPDFHATGNNRDHVVKYHDHEFYPEFLIHFQDV